MRNLFKHANQMKVLQTNLSCSFCSLPVLGTGNLFATKWVHIKHYGLKIGRPNFCWDSAYFLNSTNPEITKMGFKIPGTCYSGKKKAPARKPTNSRPEWGSTPRWSIHQNPIEVLVKKWLFQKSISPKMPKSKASLNNPLILNIPPYWTVWIKIRNIEIPISHCLQWLCDL